jgi:hypothetical protein
MPEIFACSAKSEKGSNEKGRVTVQGMLATLMITTAYSTKGNK